MDVGKRLLPKQALLYFRDQYLEGSTLKWQLSGSWMSCAIVFAKRVMALQLSSEQLGVVRPIILAALLFMYASLAWFVTDSMLKKQVQKSGMG